MTQTALTREQVLAMEPGQELDALVAQHVMGWRLSEESKTVYDMEGRPECESFWRDDEGDVSSLPNYSKDISAAWEVQYAFEHSAELEEDLTIELHNVLGIALEERTTMENIYKFSHATPEQRCKAALLAVLDI